MDAKAPSRAPRLCTAYMELNPPSKCSNGGKLCTNSIGLSINVAPSSSSFSFYTHVVANQPKCRPHLITEMEGFKLYILDMDIMEKVLEVKGEDVVKMAQQLVL
ncbi:hypothetical protein ZWY2020_021648 [Hordeum vulgare]|nr:hypothetical protein ZWY2020_021648 [Hordeum vulgare]